jgi:hypothetical protein
MLRSQLLHPARGRMNPHQQIVEGETLTDRNHQLAVQHKSPRLDVSQRVYHLRKVAGQRLA